MEASARKAFVAAALVVTVLTAATTRTWARPIYGNDCSACHGSAGFGNTVPNAVFDVIGTSQSTIPPGEFGDPDRGEGPLATYTALPGGTFDLLIQFKDTTTYDPPFLPTRWAAAIQDIFTTDPDYHLGNPDPLSWRDSQLLLVGATPPNFDGPDPAPIPTSSSEWSIYTRTQSPLIQYYATTPYPGHDWIGPFLLGVTVNVPAGVYPGWYDLEISSAGWDYDQSFAFYDDEHFYLNVAPEPHALTLLALGLLGLVRRRRIATRYSLLAIPNSPRTAANALTPEGMRGDSTPAGLGRSGV